MGSPFNTKAPTIPPLSALTSAACATYTILVSVLSIRPICRDISALWGMYILIGISLIRVSRISVNPVANESTSFPIHWGLTGLGNLTGSNKAGSGCFNSITSSSLWSEHSRMITPITAIPRIERRIIHTLRGKEFLLPPSPIMRIWSSRISLSSFIIILPPFPIAPSTASVPPWMQ